MVWSWLRRLNLHATRPGRCYACFNRINAGRPARESAMNCPKCDGEFEKVTFSGIEIERCMSCAGLWFDLMEKEDLR